MKIYLNFAAIRDFAGDEAAAYDRQVERQLGGPVRHHHLQPPAQTSARGRVSSARNGEDIFFSLELMCCCKSQLPIWLN